MRARGLSLEQVLELLVQLSIEPVLTPHPTESTRRTLLRQQQRIARLLIGRLDPSQTPSERASTIERVRTELTTAWQTADNSRERLTVADEREHVLFFLVEVIYEIIPAFYEEVETALVKTLAKRRAVCARRRCCDSAHGWAATWTATPTCMSASLRWKNYSTNRTSAPPTHWS